MTDELPWLDLTAAASMTGLSREAVRSRARRGLLPSRRGNDGRIVVQVTPGTITAPDHDRTGLVTELTAELADLREALARAVTERDAALAVQLATIAAKDDLIAELKAMLADARRPWWRRWR